MNIKILVNQKFIPQEGNCLAKKPFGNEAKNGAKNFSPLFDAKKRKKRRRRRRRRRRRARSPRAKERERERKTRRDEKRRDERVKVRL